MNRKERYENALKIAKEHGNVMFQYSIEAELKRMETDSELASEEATPNNDS